MTNKFLEIKIGYKAVRKVDNSGMYKSYWVDNTQGEVLYTPNIWSFPKICSGPLAVFNFLDDLRESVCMDKSGDFIKMFSCLYVPNYLQDDLWYYLLSARHGYVKFFMFGRDLPRGTVLASQVKLLEEI